MKTKFEQEHNGKKAMFYPATFTPEDNGGYTVSFRDIPEALTCADTLDEAKEMAQDALVTAMDFYFEDRRIVPMPSPVKKGEVLIELPDSLLKKVRVLNELAKQNVNNAILARRIEEKVYQQVFNWVFSETVYPKEVGKESWKELFDTVVAENELLNGDGERIYLCEEYETWHESHLLKKKLLEYKSLVEAIYAK